LRTTGGGNGDNRWTGYPYSFRNPIAGTTQNQSDGWFMGMVPNLVTGVCRLEDRSACFKSITYGQELRQLYQFGVFHETVYEDPALKVSKEPFERPANLSIKSRLLRT
jgi:penicillin-binding protein 1A